MQRVILHADLNGFYAAVSCLYQPEIRERPVIVAGDPEARHGIVLAKNEIAKAYHIKTGEAIWQAKQKCPGLVAVPPDYRQYLRFSRLARNIYETYTDQVESFGIDEAWLDITGSSQLFSGGQKVADEIRRRVKEELGITASIGVSYNKIFAKLGSDYKKPNATTCITPTNFKEVAWPLPVTDLLYVGAATEKKLALLNVHTIGELAQTDAKLLRYKLGKWGDFLWTFANGYDQSPVRKVSEAAAIKSIGNSTTCPRDLTCLEDIQVVMTMLAESVAARLREQGLKGCGVQISVRDNALIGFTRQAKLDTPSCLGHELAALAVRLFQDQYNWARPIRSLGVRAINLVPANAPYQLDLFGNEEKRRKQEQLALALDGLRQRFGNGCVKPALLYADRQLAAIDPKEDHVIHPMSFFN